MCKKIHVVRHMKTCGLGMCTNFNANFITRKLLVSGHIAFSPCTVHVLYFVYVHVLYIVYVHVLYCVYCTCAIIVYLSSPQNWEREFSKWLGSERLMVFAVTTDSRVEVSIYMSC